MDGKYLRAALLALLCTPAWGGQSFSTNLAEYTCTSDSLAIAPSPANLIEGLHPVALSWTASSSNPQWYRVYRGTVSGGPYTRIADCVTAASYRDLTAQDTTTYYYVITAVLNGNESSYSNQATVGIPVQDSLTVSFSRGVLLTENLTTLDQITQRSTTANRSLSESLITSDAVARQAAFQRALTEESLTTSDSISAQASRPPLVVALTESLTTSDSLTQRHALASRQLTESLATSDSLAVLAQPLGGWSGNSQASGKAIYSSGPGVIPAALFGLHFRFNQNVQQAVSTTTCPPTVLKYPNLPFGALRLWDTDTRWQNLNPSAGVFVFDCLAPYLQVARQFNVSDLIMTLSATPQWAASNGALATCDYSFLNTGDCSPPNDLNADGTGSDQHWRDFIYALGTHIAGLAPGAYMAPTYFEMWNEFTRGSGTTDCTEASTPSAWLGTCAELVRMGQDANCILTGRAITITATGTTCTAGHMNVAAVGLLPSARILTANAAGTAPDVGLWGTYLATAGALSNVDGLALHTYPFQGLGTTLPDGSATVGGPTLPAQWSAALNVLPGAAFGLGLLSTEGSWGSTTANLPDQNMQEGYIARYYLVGWSTGFREMYWYAVNNSFGTLINQNGVNGCNDHGTQLGCPTLAATGWTAVYGWMVGSTLNLPCSADASGNIWTCGLIDASGAQKLAVWDASQTCTPCTTSSYSYPAVYARYYTLDSGATATPLAGGTVAIGWKPILLSQ